MIEVGDNTEQRLQEEQEQENDIRQRNNLKDMMNTENEEEENTFYKKDSMVLNSPYPNNDNGEDPAEIYGVGEITDNNQAKSK